MMSNNKSEENMVTFKGEAIKVSGSGQKENQTAKDFELVAQDLKRVSLNSFEGKMKVLNIFPSLDTGVCAKSVEEFQHRLKNFSDLVLIHISKDLPFAQGRFCTSKGFKGAVTLSAYDSTFGKDYGLLIENGPLKGLLARCVILLDEHNKVLYQELVHEIIQEPNYGALIEHLENI